jgi:hypothetical protein
MKMLKKAKMATKHQSTCQQKSVDWERKQKLQPTNQEKKLICQKQQAISFGMVNYLKSTHTKAHTHTHTS